MFTMRFSGLWVVWWSWFRVFQASSVLTYLGKSWIGFSELRRNKREALSLSPSMLKLWPDTKNFKPKTLNPKP